MKGKKTYATGILAIVGAALAAWTGEASTMETVNIVVTALLAMFVRNGIQSIK